MPWILGVTVFVASSKIFASNGEAAGFMASLAIAILVGRGVAACMKDSP